LQNLSSTPDAVAYLRIAVSLRKTHVQCYFPSWGQAVYPLWSGRLAQPD